MSVCRSGKEMDEYRSRCGEERDECLQIWEGGGRVSADVRRRWMSVCRCGEEMDECLQI